MCRQAFHFLLYAIVALSSVARSAHAAPQLCSAPQQFITAPAPLAQFSTAIAAGGPVAILALGSATTVGSANAAGQPTSVARGASFPRYMLQALQTALPAVEFRLTIRGGRGMTAADMLTPLQVAMQEDRFRLVLWQTATVEALRGLRPENLQSALNMGTSWVRDAGGNVVLIDPQFSRMLQANAELEPYEAALQQAARQPGVTLFQRFGLTRAWTTEDRIDMERTPADQRDKALDALNMCLGQALAKFVLSGVAAPKP